MLCWAGPHICVWVGVCVCVFVCASAESAGRLMNDSTQHSAFKRVTVHPPTLTYLQGAVTVLGEEALPQPSHTALPPLLPFIDSQLLHLKTGNKCVLLFGRF